MNPADPAAILPAAFASQRQQQLAALRSTLAHRFPHAHTPAPTTATSYEFPITQLHHTLSQGTLTEAYGSTGGGSLLLEAALSTAAEQQTLLGLVDGRGSFDPTLPPSHLARLLWVICRHAPIAIKAADLLLRDGNLPVVILDLQFNPTAELRRIPPSTWYRFQRILEGSPTALLVLTPAPLVSSASTRLQLTARWDLDAMRQHRQRLAPEVVHHQRRQFPPMATLKTA